MKTALAALLLLTLGLQPKPAPAFAPDADPDAALTKAIAAAATDDIRVLVTWGAMGDARTMSVPRIAKLPGLATPSPAFSNEYKQVNVEMGHADRNLALAQKLGIKIDPAALPIFTVLDAAGKRVATVSGPELASKTDPSAIDPDALGTFLTKYHAIPPDPNAQLEAARNRAKTEDKLVFLWFSAPW